MKFHVCEARPPRNHSRSKPARILHLADCAGSRSGEVFAINANAGSAPGPARRSPRQWRRHAAPDLGGVPATHREAERWFGEGEMRSDEPAPGSSLTGATAPAIVPWQYLRHRGTRSHPATEQKLSPLDRARHFAASPSPFDGVRAAPSVLGVPYETGRPPDRQPILLPSETQGP